jgi:hypothetical protein
MVKGRVVFFRKEREKISTLKPLTVWIFAVSRHAEKFSVYNLKKHLTKRFMG